MLGDIALNNVIMLIDELNDVLLDIDFDNSSRNNLFMLVDFASSSFVWMTSFFASFVIISSTKCVMNSVNTQSSMMIWP